MSLSGNDNQLEERLVGLRWMPCSWGHCVCNTPEQDGVNDSLQH